MGSEYYGDMKYSEPYKDKKTGEEKKSWHFKAKVFRSEQGNFSVFDPELNRWYSIFRREQRQVDPSNLSQEFKNRTEKTYVQPGTEENFMDGVPPNMEEPPGRR